CVRGGNLYRFGDPDFW
nr:immunoglobulin heavy chain junction region [Macaca mulatta]MOX38734.1 immunoglobulin heavy chain junction region [Macaca mulatta]MOX38778.1 immunoglobulin heavy chain junction region [Macaca mulatta]MOX39667.1 immunoglobulin heavy chain junction region [Macaca mulatta]MOX39906.1 immunoglobulin heavy chain junction region [Macaca mulatta]